MLTEMVLGGIGDKDAGGNHHKFFSPLYHQTSARVDVYNCLPYADPISNDTINNHHKQ